MAKAVIKIEKEQDLTFIVFSGKVIPADVIAALKAFYETEITSKILWNFSNCDVTALLSNDLYSFLDSAKGYAHLRVKGKSALVGPSDLAFGLGRMQTTLADLDDYPILAQIFRSVDEAMTWLK